MQGKFLWGWLLKEFILTLDINPIAEQFLSKINCYKQIDGKGVYVLDYICEIVLESDSELMLLQYWGIFFYTFSKIMLWFSASVFASVLFCPDGLGNLYCFPCYIEVGVNRPKAKITFTAFSSCTIWLAMNVKIRKIKTREMNSIVSGIVLSIASCWRGSGMVTEFHILFNFVCLF